MSLNQEALWRAAEIEQRLEAERQAAAEKEFHRDYDDPRQKPRLKPEAWPTREACNPNCPDEAFLWMLVGKPGMKGAPLEYPAEYLRLVSRRLWDCGARPSDCDNDFKVDAEPVIKYVFPKRTDPHWMTSAGSWVPMDAPDDPGPTWKDIIGALPLAERQAVKRQVDELGEAFE